MKYGSHIVVSDKY